MLRTRSAVGGEASPAASGESGPLEGLVPIPAGEFLMGTEHAIGYPADGEGPVRRVVLDAFVISTVCVSNNRFEQFITTTGHHTDAERHGWSFVFGGFLPDDFPGFRVARDG